MLWAPSVCRCVFIFDEKVFFLHNVEPLCCICKIDTELSEIFLLNWTVWTSMPRRVCAENVRTHDTRFNTSDQPCASSVNTPQLRITRAAKKEKKTYVMLWECDLWIWICERVDIHLCVCVLCSGFVSGSHLLSASVQSDPNTSEGPKVQVWMSPKTLTLAMLAADDTLSPDSLYKSHDFKSCCVRRNVTNFSTTPYNQSCLHVNSVFNANKNVFSFLVTLHYRTGLSASMTLAAFWTHSLNQFQPFPVHLWKEATFYWRQACQICHKHPTVANIGYFFVASWGSPRLPLKKARFWEYLSYEKLCGLCETAVYNTFLTF